MNLLNKISVKSRIILCLIILVFIHFSGSVTGDEEKVYNFIETLLKNDVSFYEWIKDPLKSCEIWPKCHSAFLKHNFGWFLINALIVKISSSIFFFYDSFFDNIFLVEIILSFFNSLCFWLSFVILYINFHKKFSPYLILATIIIFVYGTYLNNFSAGGYVESLLFLLVSIRLCYISKKDLNNKDIIIISIIDSLMISLRFFYIWFAVLFLIANFINHSENKKYNKLIYFIFPLIFLSIFYYNQSLIPAQAYLNTNELKDINFLNYYYIKILRSFCVSDIISIISVFLNRVYLSFFSVSVGLFFIFPIIILTFISYKDKIYWFKILMLLGYIFAFSLEQNFYLPAGISGHRGLGPILIVFFPEVLNAISNLSKSKLNFLTSLFLSLLIIIFSSSLYYRSTLGHYVVFAESNYVLKTEKNIPKCYKKETFGHNFIDLHPGIFGWKILSLNLSNESKTTIRTKIGEKKIYLKDFTPQTLIHRVNFLIKYNFYNYEDNPLKNFFLKYPFFVKISKFLYFFSLIVIFLIPLYLFNYCFLRKTE